MKRSTVIPALLALAGPLAPTLAADAPADATGIPSPFEEVEPAIGDDPASVGLRQLSVDLRVPNGFQNVYAVPGSPGEFMRIEGGLFAVFPRSEYASSPSGTYAVIPSGTVFHIGAPPTGDEARAADALRPRASRMNTRLMQALTEKVGPHETSESPGVPIATAHSKHASTKEDRPHDLSVAGRSTILNDMEYRQRRLTELMTRAVTTARRRAGARGDVTQPDATESVVAASEASDQAARGRSSSPSSK